METLTEVVRSSKQIKIQGFSVTSAMSDGDALKSRWKVGGYDWEVQLFPNSIVVLHLYLRSNIVSPDSSVKVMFSARVVDPSGKLKRHQGILSVAHNFKRSGYRCYGGPLMSRSELQTSDDLVPSSGLNHHLGELLHKGTGADVTLVAAGESFAAHKAILASRSPVFMAEFFGHMKEKRSPRVEIKDMDAAILGAMLRFIYTDSVPEPEDGDDGEVAAMHTAQHLLAAADRYGIDRLKVACEDRLFDGVTVDTARGDDSGLGGAARLLVLPPESQVRRAHRCKP
ncbi:hypothetical protein SORBI_3010G222200 [Sorghum bicolor]|uniref:BTB domain-containing protein n=1 Tax=Sorghum bicolor TaxID=4558 RepID=A0A1W0VUA6_SORBI|nr:hypothetical protein SORBI_3010G222200 [Sorghum bicolor]